MTSANASLRPSRRGVLASAAAAGLSLQLLARPSFAAGAGRRKLIVIVCRGGMDGLSAAPPVGDPDYAALRGPIALGPEALKLDNTFALHPALASVHALALAGQARIAPAIATTDRARSHFEAQDVLESGAAAVYSSSSGWLNRALTARGPGRRLAALSADPTAPLILRGEAPCSSWSPGRLVDTSARLPILLQDLYRSDPLLGPALARGLATETLARQAMANVAQPASLRQPPSTDASGLAGHEAQTSARALGQMLAGFMREADGPQIVALSLDGFDTHAREGAAQGQLAGRLAYLDATLDGIHTGLGPDWKRAVVLVATEFGRAAKVNGTGGTDHGTASTALVLGGALKPGGIIGDWPGLKPAALFEDRDVRPTLDMRSLFKGVLADHLGLDRAALDKTVFPDSAAARPLTGLV